jgi:hypothetical protein
MIGLRTRASVGTAARQPAAPTVEWNESAGLAARRMSLEKLESLEVMADGKPVGRVTRRDIDRCEKHGNWLEAVMVLDLISEPTDTCN